MISDRQEKMNNLLYAAILSGEEERVHESLRLGADVNADRGRPLRVCAEQPSYLMAKLLFLKGADFDYCIRCVEEDIRAIPVKVSGKYLPIEVPKNAEDVPKLNKLRTLCARLQSYRKSFLEYVVPQEQLRKLDELLENQKAFAEQLKQFRQELDLITRPQDLEKGKLPPSKQPQEKDHGPKG